MGLENFDLEELPPEEEGPIAEEANNRTFLIIAAALGAIALLALICIAVYTLVLLPRNRQAQRSQQMTLEAQQTEVEAIVAATSTAAEITALAAAFTDTPTATPLPSPSATPTPVLAMPTEQPTSTLSPDLATATALYATLQANATNYIINLTASPMQPTQMPTTGFADEVGLPAMFGMAALLIAVIFLARRLRTAT